MITRADFAPGVEPIEVGTSSDRPTLTPGGSMAAQLVEGRYRHETDTDTLYFWNGSAWTQVGITTEQVQDLVGAMLTGNTETGITVTYEDTDGTIDFVVSLDLNGLTTDTPALGDYIPFVDITESNAPNKMLVTELLKLVYPVESIYMSYTSTNPATTFGFGTWSQVAQGEALVGFKSADTPFGTLGSIGAAGEKTHTLVGNEGMQHYHDTYMTTANIADTGSGTTVMIPNGGGGTSFTSNDPAAGTAAHNNIQPSYVVYVWRRTA